MLKHFGMVWQSLSLSIYVIILRGPFEEQLGKRSISINKFKKIRGHIETQNDIGHKGFSKPVQDESSPIITRGVSHTTPG
jgi:hypothetical protein